MYRKTVISLHGIRTRGEWQKQLAPYISAQGWIYHPLDYGHFRAVDLLLNIFKKRKKIQWLRKELNTINQTSDGHPPSVIVHSNGSFLLGEVLKKFPDICFDQVVLTGSIIDRNFDWISLKKKGQIRSVLNIVGKKDIPSNLAQWFVKGAGNSGSKGFSSTEGIEEVVYENFGHSDSHAHDVFKNQIIPFINTAANIPPSDGRARIAEINQLIESSNYKIVILIDDMERADPEVLRKLFPVIDKLTAFKNCSFIFAIDPQRIVKAFSTSNTSPEDHKAEAKGFMDKVFDMTILLPDANEQEIIKLAKSWVNAEQFPRLHSSLDKFSLPTNPRDLQRYLTKAKYIEALFFTNRYEDNEKNFDIVYLICLAESIYPGFIDALRDAPIKTKVEQLLDHNRLDHVLEDNDVNISTIESIVTLIKEKCSTTNSNITLEQIIRSLAPLNSYSAGYAPTPKTSIDWVTGGYTQRYLITDTERSVVMEKFSKAKGKTTILELIPAEVLRKEESTAAFLQFYIDGILDAIKSRSRKGERKHLIQSLNHLDSYLKSSGEAHKLQTVLDSRINAWITTGVILEKPLESDFLIATHSFIQHISTSSLNQQLIGLFHSGHDIHLLHRNLIGNKESFLKDIKDALAEEATSLLLRIFSSDDYYKDYYTVFREPDVMTLFLRGHPYWTDVEKFSKLLITSDIKSRVAYDYAESLLNGWAKFDRTVNDFYELLKSNRNPDTLLRLVKHLFQASNADHKFSLSEKSKKSLDAIESPDLAEWFTSIFDDFLQHSE